MRRRKGYTPPDPKKPHMRGAQLLRFSRPLYPSDRFTAPLYPDESLISFYNDGRHVYYRLGKGPWQHLRYRDFSHSGNWVCGMRIMHRGHHRDARAYIIVYDSLWEWYLTLEPRYYYNLIDVGYERALFRSRDKYYPPSALQR